MSEVITKSEAKRLGLKQYFTGKPCKNGHVANRWVTGRCVECFHVFYSTNSDKWKVRREENLEQYKELSRQVTRRWRANKPEHRLFSSIKHRCKRENIPFTISLTDIVIPTHCPILGVDIITDIGRGQIQNGPSVDRIVPNLGYIPGNIQVISRLANSMKNAGTLEQCVMLGEWAKQQLAHSQERSEEDKTEKKEDK